MLEPAIDYAENGFPMYRYMSLLLKSPEIARQFEFFPQGAAYFRPNGRMPEPGERFIQRDLANVLKTMVRAEERARAWTSGGVAGRARRAFIGAIIARSIVSFSEQVGGLLTLDDFANYHSRWKRRCDRLTVASRFTAIMRGRKAPRCSKRSISWRASTCEAWVTTAPLIHVLTEALKLAMADRERYYGDPEFVHVPLEALLSKDYAAERGKLIDLNKPPPKCLRANPEAGRALGGTMDVNGVGGPVGSSMARPISVDEEGNIFLATPSGGRLNGGCVVPGMGFTLSHRSEIFYLDPHHANALQPGKRPRTTLVCYFAFKDHQPG